MQAPSSVYEIWSKITTNIQNLATNLNEDSFLNSKSSKMSDFNNYPKFFFQTASNNSIESTQAGSALTKPFINTFLITKQFYSNNQKQILSIVTKLLGLSISAATTFFLLKWLMKSLDPTNADKISAKTRADRIMKLIGISNIELNEYELFIASNIILPNDIDCSWNDIGGLEHIIDDLRETVIYPLKNFDTYPKTTNEQANTLINRRSKLIQPPKGVLLFGPPGNAKTMIAKALAKESGARFINLQVSTLFDKWFGESQKRTEAVFSLAAKVQPAIIFIDEIDSFLRSRRSDDHECTSTMKTQFMTLWDGLGTTQRENRILIIGATNRPEDVDSAILRRMPQMFYIGLPNELQRKKILKVILKDEILAEDVDLDEIAERTVDYSGSDLHELCRMAAMNCFIEQLKKMKLANSNSNNDNRNNHNDDDNDENTFKYENNSNEPIGSCIRKIDFDVGFEKMSIKNLTNKKRFDFTFARGNL